MSNQYNILTKKRINYENDMDRDVINAFRGKRSVSSYDESTTEKVSHIQQRYKRGRTSLEDLLKNVAYSDLMFDAGYVRNNLLNMPSIIDSFLLIDVEFPGDSLEGGPVFVQSLEITSPNIKSLKGSPIYVNRNMRIVLTSIQDLEGCSDVGGSITIGYNPNLTSLKGLPQSIRNIAIKSNPSLKTFEGIPKKGLHHVTLEADADVFVSSIKLGVFEELEIKGFADFMSTKESVRNLSSEDRNIFKKFSEKQYSIKLYYSM
jgi:hypothetical protein